MPYHAIALLSGGRQKTLPNKTESDMLSQVVLPFVANGTITARWGSKIHSYQVLELAIYQTKESWDKKNGPLADLTKNKKNCFEKFNKEAEKLLAKDKPKIFVITPIQGSKHGDQEQQRILTEYDKRFEIIEKIVGGFGAIAIRIDRESPLEDLVGRIKKEIKSSQFVIADLTDERQSCYFEAGYSEASGKDVIYIASKNSVMQPGTATKVHFDIHMNVQFFTNHSEMEEKIRVTITKNKSILFPAEEGSRLVIG